SDICINFPISEITYNAELSKSFLKFMGDGDELYKIYGHLFAKNVMIGGKLFIDNLTSVTTTQIDFFKTLLIWTYDSVKCNKKNPFDNLFAVKFFPKI